MKSLLACVLAMAASVACAEVIELEGTIKSIDTDARSIAITRQTPKGEKVLELEIAKNAGDVSGLKAGDRISFAYNPDAEIVSKIERTGAGSVRVFAAERPVMAVAVHPDGKRVAYSSGLKTYLMNITDDEAKKVVLTHEPLKVQPHVFVTAVAISPSGTLISTAGNEGSVRIWDITGPQPKEQEAISKNTGVVTPVCFSPDGELLATAERASGITRLFDVTDRKAKPTAVLAPPDGDVWSLSFSPDGKKLVAGMWFNESEPKYGQVVAWDLTKTPATRTVVVPKTGLPRDVHFLPDGRSVVFGDRGLVRHVSVSDGKDLGVLDCYPSDSEIVALSVSPDGKYIAVGGSPKEVKVLEISSGKEIDQLRNDYDRVEGIAFSPDGKSVLIGSKDSKARVWQPQLD